MPTPTVTFYELANSPRETFDEDGFKAVMSFECAWTDRIELAKQLAGGATLFPDGRTRRIDPFEYPYGTSGQVPPGTSAPLGTAPVCVGVEVEPLADSRQSQNTDTRFSSYSKAIVAATFRVPTWKRLAVPTTSGGQAGDYEWVTETLEPSAEFITMPNQKLWWNAAKTEPVAESEAPGFLVKMMEWTRTRHRVIRPHASVFDLQGCVNDSVLSSEKFNRQFAAETLLYVPPRLEPVVMPDGTKAHDLVMRFLYRAEGWNKFWHAGKTEEGPGTGDIWRPVPVYADRTTPGRPLALYKPQPFDDLLWK